MNMTDQIILAADSNFRFQMFEISRQASNISDKDDLFNFYKEWNKTITKKVLDSEYATDLLFRDILVYNFYESIASFIHQCFYPVDSLAEIEFRENTSVDFDYEYAKIPIVKKNYDFSKHNKEGVKVTSYISNLFLLRGIREKLGYDVNRYPEKCGVIAFKFENVIYVWEKGYDGNKRLTIDQTANQEILKVFYEIFYTQTKSNDDIYSMLDVLPFIVGQEAQKEFDIIWYRYSKQTPLTYRCFPNTHTIDLSFPRVSRICRHKGEYCIKQDKIDLRYERFLDLHKTLDQNEKEELIINTIDYLNDFIKTDCFDKPVHKKIYLNLLEKVKLLTAENIELFDTISNTLADALEKFKENGYSFSPIIPHLDGWTPRTSIFDYGDENSQPIANRFLPSQPNWELINASIKETREENKKEQIEIIKTAYIEAMKEINDIPSNLSQHIIQEENVSDNNTLTVASKELKNNINPNNDKLDATHFIGFMNGKNPLKGKGLILGDDDYKRLVSYTNYLISECKVPLDIIPMPKTNLTNETIVYTYSLIHDRCIKGPKTKKEYIVFIIKVFSQFTDNNVEIGNNYRKTTAYSKFRADEPREYKKLIKS